MIGDTRLAWLCSDENSDPASRTAYRELAAQRAAGKPPGLLTQLGTAAAAAGWAVGQAASGGPILVSPAELDRRLTICRSCPEYRPKTEQCGKCGCYLPLKARLESETGQCPRGMW